MALSSMGRLQKYRMAGSGSEQLMLRQVWSAGEKCINHWKWVHLSMEMSALKTGNGYAYIVTSLFEANTEDNQHGYLL